MTLLVSLGFVVLTVIIFIQDYYSRSIHLFVFIILGLLGVIFFWDSPVMSLLDLLLNVGYLLILFLLSYGILYIKKGELSGLIGLGDVIYLGLIAVYFNFPLFPILITFSFVVAFILHLACMSFSINYRRVGKVPLAGFQAPIIAMTFLYDNYVQSISTYLY